MKASRELCFYCFDAVISALEKQNCAPPEFDDGSCPLCISWGKRVKLTKDSTASVEAKKSSKFEPRGSLITMAPIKLHSESCLKTIRASAFEDPQQPPITREDIPLLRCSVSVILSETYKSIQNFEDWDIGKHGLRIEFYLNGKQHSKVYHPETILARGWKKHEAIEMGIKKAGYNGELTPRFLKDLKIIRFQTSTCIVSFKDYLKHVQQKESEGKSKQASPHNEEELSDEQAKTQRTILRRRRRYINSLRNYLEEKGIMKRPRSSSALKSAGDGGSGSSWSTWLFALGLLGLVMAVLVLRYGEVTYDKDYEEFQLNYDILGVERGAPMPVIKKAYRKLSLQFHPDKNRGCKECAEKYIEISNAYTQLVDYDKGILKLVNKPSSRGGPPPRQER